MTEDRKRAACEQYLAIHAERLLRVLRSDGAVVVNCQEGLHRSAEFAQQLLHLCARSAPWEVIAMSADAPLADAPPADAPPADATMRGVVTGQIREDAEEFETHREGRGLCAWTRGEMSFPSIFDKGCYHGRKKIPTPLEILIA
jgi:hypothetical protein